MTTNRLPTSMPPVRAHRARFQPRRAAVVARRIIRQVLGDRRSLAMLLLVPVLVILLLGYIMRSSNSTATLLVEGTGALPLSNLPLPGNLAVVAAPPGQAGAGRTWNADGLLSLSTAPPKLTVRADNPATVKLLQAAAGQIAQAAGRPPSGATPGSAGAPPAALTTDYLHGGPEFDSLDYAAPVLIGFFAFFFVFLLTSVSFLRERTTGTLERLLISPMQRLELVGGYMLGFGLFALIQAFLVVVVSLFLLRIHSNGQLPLVLLIVALLAVGAVNLGIFCSTFARTELQAIQFIPIVLVPQALLSGLLFAVESMPRWLQVVARVVPMTYAAEALRAVMVAGAGLGDGTVLRDTLVLAGFCAFFLAAAALTLRKRLA